MMGTLILQDHRFDERKIYRSMLLGKLFITADEIELESEGLNSPSSLRNALGVNMRHTLSHLWVRGK